MDDLLGWLFEGLAYLFGGVFSLGFELAGCAVEFILELLGQGAASANPIVATICTVLLLGIVGTCVALAAYGIWTVF